MLNRQNFLTQREANLFKGKLIPQYAKAATVKKDGSGYWLNVTWNCGVIAPLTIQEAIQAENEHAESPTVSGTDWP